ncbi:hypothetical protein Bca101_054685 [Brassica carinata]
MAPLKCSSPSLRLQLPSPPSRLQLPSPPSRLRPPPDPPPPCTPLLVPLEAPSPPEPPDPPESPFHLVLLFVFMLSYLCPLVTQALPPSVYFLQIYIRDSQTYASVDVLISLVCYLGFSHGLSRTGFVRPLSQMQSSCCSMQLYLCGSFFMKVVSLPISATTLCGFGAGSSMLKIRDTSNIEVLIKGCLAILKIVNCALAAVSISGCISLFVVFNSQGFVSFSSSMVVKFRGLLYAISCLSMMSAPIFICCICFLLVSLAMMAMLSFSVNTFFIHGE